VAELLNGSIFYRVLNKMLNCLISRNCGIAGKKDCGKEGLLVSEFFIIAGLREKMCFKNGV